MPTTRTRRTTMRGTPVYINASLIREARMIYQNLFGGRAPGPQAKSATMHFPTLKCGFCIVVRKKRPEDAITVVNGHACCHDHMYYAQGGDFNTVLIRIQRDEGSKTKRA